MLFSKHSYFVDVLLVAMSYFSFSVFKILHIPTMENGPRIAKKFHEEITGIQVWCFLSNDRSSINNSY